VLDKTSTAANEGLTEYKKTYADALSQLQNFVGKSDALRILSNSQYSDWRNKANSDMKALKRRGIANRTYPNVTQTPPAPKKK
jgi:predicted secreted protein